MSWQKKFAPENYYSNTSAIPLSQKLSIVKGGKVLSGKLRGCDPNCQDTSPIVICPTCKRWGWHRNCIVKVFTSENIPIPDFSDVTVDWKCIHCR